jgi:citronellol/citronellal dehydrogenase
MIACVTSGSTDDSTEQSEIFAPGLLSGQVALVTGGGTGLGKATALELVRCGATVVIAGRRGEVLEEAVAEIHATVGRGGADWIAGDIREHEDSERLVASVLERHGRLDVLVNNAGGQYFTPAEGIAAKGWQAVWRLNVEGMLNMAQAAHARGIGTGPPDGARADGGSPDAARAGTGPPDGVRAGTIINVTLSPHHGMPGMAHSGAARAAVEELTSELAHRWAGEGIAVMAVAAGHFDTEALEKYPASLRAGMARTVPLQRLGTVREHAWLVALLASPLGMAFSGSTVTLDGARDNWFGPWPPPGLADASGEVPTEERKGARSVG